MPYFEHGKKIESTNSKAASVYTLKKVTSLKVAKSSNGNVKVSWKDINGESGYQVSKAVIKSKKNIVSKTSKKYKLK